MGMNDELEIERRKLRLARIDAEQFQFFYDKFSDQIYRFIYYKTLDRDLTRDLVSETFAKALDNLWKFHWQGVTFGAWLYRIAINLIHQHYRKSNRFKEVGLESAGSHSAPGPGPLAEILQDEKQSRLYACLSKLDELSISIFILHYWNDLTVREISAVLNIKEGTIQSRLKRDRDKLQEMMLQDEETHQVSGQNKIAKAISDLEISRLPNHGRSDRDE